MAAAVANAGAERSGSLAFVGRTSGTVTVMGRDGLLPSPTWLMEVLVEV